MALERTLDAYGNFVVKEVAPEDKDAEKNKLLLEIAQLKSKVKELEDTNSDLVKKMVEINDSYDVAVNFAQELEAENKVLIGKSKK